MFIYFSIFRSFRDHFVKKRVTKESAEPLRKWLAENEDSPYPNKAEKRDLAYTANMTLYQVCNWFANARRRMKEEGKKWREPTNRADDDSYEDDDDDEMDIEIDPGKYRFLSYQPHNLLFFSAIL